MSKRKNPFCKKDDSPSKKRKVCDNWCIKLTATTKSKPKESVFSIHNESSFTVGRDPSCCQILFADTPMISRVHCEFMFDEMRQLFVKDLKSTNGVFVNNAMIDKNGSLVQIFDGDIIRFGKCKKLKKHLFNHEYKVQIIQTKNFKAILEETTAKNKELNLMKERLHKQQMNELSEKAKQQKIELEAKQKEFERMKEKMEREKLQMEEEKQRLKMEKEFALKEADDKMKKKEKETQKKEMEAMKKIKEIEEAEKKLKEERKKQQIEMEEYKKKMEEEAAKIKEQVKEEEKKQNDDAIEEETTCCMCYDILLKAHSLECGHTTCHQCIREWIDEKGASAVCPVCRQEIKNDPTPCRALDNIIESLHISKQSEEAKREWTERMNEYKTWKLLYDEQLELKKKNQDNNNANANGFNWADWTGNNQQNDDNNNNNNHNNNNYQMQIDDEEEDDYEPEVSYSIERARSGRSTCRGCWQNIQNRALRFGVETDADPRRGTYYRTMHWYHPNCFGRTFANNPACRQVDNINNNSSLSRSMLSRKLREIFESPPDSSSSDSSSSDSDSSSSSSSDNRLVAQNNNGGRATFVVDGINFRNRINSLENLTVRQLKRYCEVKGINIPSGTRKAALAAMVRRNIARNLPR